MQEGQFLYAHTSLLLIPPIRPPQSAYLIETVWLVAVLSMLLLVARAVVVVPFAVVHNRLPHSDKLARRDVIIVW